jgi:hypothetical protein
MPLDHYIPQVHLKNFYSPVLGDRMYATRKSDLKSFTPSSKSVCGINDGSTDAYLKEGTVTGLDGRFIVRYILMRDDLPIVHGDVSRRSFLPSIPSRPALA